MCINLKILQVIFRLNLFHKKQECSSQTRTVLQWTQQAAIFSPNITADHRRVSKTGFLFGSDLTLQDPVHLPTVSQSVQVHSDGCQVGSVLLKGVTAATVQLDGPLWQTEKQDKIQFVSRWFINTDKRSIIQLTVAAPMITTSGFVEASCNTQKTK